MFTGGNPVLLGGGVDLEDVGPCAEDRLLSHFGWIWSTVILSVVSGGWRLALQLLIQLKPLCSAVTSRSHGAVCPQSDMARCCCAAYALGYIFAEGGWCWFHPSKRVSACMMRASR